MVTWDEAKRQLNLRNHGLDFVGCEAVFDGPVETWDDNREAYGELRINLLGLLNGVVVHMTYTERGDDLHVISLRKAEKYEIRFFTQRLPHYQ
ncbi:MAG: BrnT family toxin [Pseudomonadota bacterium]|nr:BrnT family toxin [Pseudomonadota bacterium]